MRMTIRGLWASVAHESLQSCESQISACTKQGTYMYLNNIVEANHRAPKQVIRPTRGFQTFGLPGVFIPV